MGFRVSLHRNTPDLLMSALCQKADILEGFRDDRFTPKSGHADHPMVVAKAAPFR